MCPSPFISICIPVYNGASYLLEAIESALKQTYPHFEVLIVDDNSIDNSINIASQYSQLDSRIRIIQNPQNLGLVNNWNRCIELAKGEWIKFLFQDDLLEPDCLEKMINAQKRSFSAELLIFCRREVIYEDSVINQTIEKFSKRKFFWDIFPDKNNITFKDIIRIISRYPGKNIFGEPSSFLIHKSVFDRLEKFDANFSYICDLEFWLRAGANMPILFIPETLAHFRVHNKSTTYFIRHERWVQMRYIDRLKLFYKFLYDDLYMPLRKDISIWPCRLFLKTQTAIFARRARIDTTLANENLKNEFNDYCVKNKDIDMLSKRNIFSLVIPYFLSKICLELTFAFNKRHSRS